MEPALSQSLTPQDVETMLSKVYELLKTKSIPRMQFYSEIGISAGAMSQWKLGKTTPTYNSIAKIADYLGVTVDELTGDTAQKAAAPKGDGLSDGAKRLIERYENASEEDRRRILAVVDAVVGEKPE